ncbi:Fructosamine kinase-domain-containing protein [Penicillium malachiteum]|nr:Fructosamine kinase-domain-containing protein [Penicillium malachiteum]
MSCLVLPDVADVLEVDCTGQSAWAKRTRIRVLNISGIEETYFLKVNQVSTGPHGKNSLKGEFESTLAIHYIVPDFCPKPVAWGTHQNDPDAHFYLCKFYEFDGGMPDPKSFCEQLAKLHSDHSSPNGKFGFHFTT